MDEKLAILKMLRHTRHDYLNTLQLIKGYLQLEKYEKANEIIDNVANSYMAESALQNINLPHLAHLFITFNWQKHNFVLSYEIKNSTVKHKLNDQKITDWFKILLLKLNENVDKFSLNELFAFIFNRNEQLCFSFTFSGKIINYESIEEFLYKNNEIITISDFVINNETFEITICCT